MTDKTQIKFLIVDDSSTMRRIVHSCLIKYGAIEDNITEATDGLEALSCLGMLRFGCILADWNMPNCDGIELLKRTRATAGYEKVPFILITSEASRDDVITALKAGVTDYIVKPISFDSLNKKLNNALA